MQSVFAAMGRCPLFEGIPKEKYPNVLTCLQGEARAVSKDQVLLRMGERQSRPGVVMWGTLRISLYSEDGNLLTIERLDAGMVFGESLVCSMAEDSPIQIDAITDGEVLYLDFDPLLLQQENACPFRTRVTANLLREMGREALFLNRKMRILADAIGQLALGESVHLPESGTMREISSTINQTSDRLSAQRDQLGQRDLARAEWIRGVSHDIRTPMNAIIGYADLASRHLDDPAKLEKYMENIQVCGQNLLMLLNNVLDLARIENDKTEIEYSVSDIEKDFRNCIAMFQNQADSKGQTLTVTTHLLYPYIYADAPHLTEICTNLVSNAVKYTGVCGTIHCDVTQKPGKKEDWCDTMITVADNGIGMSQEFQKHIFEPFERERTSTVSKVEGSGIGMGIVKKLVGLMGGTVEVESRIGVGSTFIVTIPCRIASQEETQAKRDTTSSDKKSLFGVKILLTEDNDLNAEIAAELLQEEGCTVDRAKDGVECVDMLEKAANGTYQLILMDIQMPVMNGYDAAKKIRRMEDPQKADIPIIAMTANAFSEDRQAALDAGMNDHVAKPINMNVLVPTIRKYL